MLRYCLFLLFLFAMTVSSAQQKTDDFLLKLLSSNTHPVFQQVINDPQTYRLQIIYTEINRDKANKPSFKNYYFNYNPELYFNPASMVKMPLAFLALEKLNTMKQKGIDKYTTIVFDSSEAWHRPLYKDESAKTGLPTIAHLIKRALLISENDPYNRLYQFVGQGPANELLHRKGYKDVRITRQFMGLNEQQNSITNPIRFLDKKGNTIYAQPALVNTTPFDFSSTVKLGKGYINRENKLVNEPFDFTKHNYLSLESMQQMLQAVLFPHAVPAKRRFNFSKDDYTFLYRYLSQYPSETPDPKYDDSIFYDSYVKFFFLDSTHKMPPHVRVFNKVGWSYGFQTDVSYVVDFKNNIEYMLSATVHVNSDGIYNDNKYEYETIGLPFLRQLGQTIYDYELKRRRTFKPNLSAFKIQYEKRDPNDTRPPLQEVDN
jgi:hypothetical protein